MQESKPLGDLWIPKFLIAADIKLKTLGNEWWPNWQTIITSDISKLPIDPWIRSTSSSKHLSLDANVSTENTNNSDDKTGLQEEATVKHGNEQEHKQAAGANIHTEVRKGKQRAQVMSDKSEVNNQPQHNNDDADKSMTPKRKGILKIPLQKSKPAEQVISAPFCVRPPGPGKIWALLAQDHPVTQASIGSAGLLKVKDNSKIKHTVMTTKEKAMPRHDVANHAIGAEEETWGWSQRPGPLWSSEGMQSKSCAQSWAPNKACSQSWTPTETTKLTQELVLARARGRPLSVALNGKLESKGRDFVWQEWRWEISKWTRLGEDHSSALGVYILFRGLHLYTLDLQISCAIVHEETMRSIA